MNSRDVVFPPHPHALYQRHSYSPAVRANGFLFVSGQVGSREDGTPEPDLVAEVRLAFANLDAILAAAGCTFADVVDTTYFMVDPAQTMETIWPVVQEYLGPGPHPALTATGVTWLSGFRFEIKVVAKLPGEAAG
ncbi:RidA family protein [Luteimonas kalidii]|uniref:RidA family protein n=1 Tax=Luteimonas kalidii TaxID=3042025 RepID=A0ABT6JWA6_9GAMM|nr:RidA family protein [Luteimonas kalidii]MDH5834857.1 RidA family protein [Luteimonas kalidii]